MKKKDEANLLADNVKAMAGVIEIGYAGRSLEVDFENPLDYVDEKSDKRLLPVGVRVRKTRGGSGESYRGEVSRGVLQSACRKFV